MNGKTYLAFNQFVGFAVGMHAIGNKHIDQFPIGVAPHHIARETLMAICFVAGHGRKNSIGFFKARGVEAQSTSVTGVNGVGFGEKPNSLF